MGLIARASTGGRNARVCPMITLLNLVLHAEDLCWLGDTADERAHDQCAHGYVTLAIGGTVFAGPREADGLNVTGAGLFLLRTLSYSHTSGLVRDRRQG